MKLRLATQKTARVLDKMDMYAAPSKQFYPAEMSLTLSFLTQLASAILIKLTQLGFGDHGYKKRDQHFLGLDISKKPWQGLIESNAKLRKGTRLAALPPRA